jgi:hypothetical protein
LEDEFGGALGESEQVTLQRDAMIACIASVIGHG